MTLYNYIHVAGNFRWVQCKLSVVSAVDRIEQKLKQAKIQFRVCGSNTHICNCAAFIYMYITCMLANQAIAS